MTARHNNNSVGNCCNSNTTVLEESVPEPTLSCQSIFLRVTADYYYPADGVPY